MDPMSDSSSSREFGFASHNYLKDSRLRRLRVAPSSSKDQNSFPKPITYPPPSIPISWWPKYEDILSQPARVSVSPPEISNSSFRPEGIDDLAQHYPYRSSFSSGFDSGWKPSSASNISLLSSPGHFSDVPSANQRSTNGQCFAAGRAFHCVTKHRDLVRSTLTECGWDGEYMIQVGFNENMLRLGQGILQEIHISLEKDATPLIIERLATIFDPFPVHFHTPSETQCVPQLPPQKTDIWEMWTRSGIFRASNQPPIDADTHSSRSNRDHSFSPSGGSGGNGDSDEWSGYEQEDSDNRSDDSEGGSDQNNGDNSPRKNFGKKPHKPISRGLSIPFSSTLTCKGEDTLFTPHPSIHFKTHACIDVKIESNFNSKSRPPNSHWAGPWIQTSMTLLGAEVQEEASSATLGYSLGLTQVRITTSSCPASILHFSPVTVRAKDDDIVKKTEKTTKGGIQATLGVNPSVRLEGTFGRSSGEEVVQKRWEILPHCLGSERNEVTGDPQTTMMWKYIHNDKSYQRETGNVFDPRPSTIFGLSRAAQRMPVLEVEVIMYYSCPPTPSRTLGSARTWLTGNEAPAYINFLHQTSVLVDLGKVEGNSWVVDLGMNDHQEPDQLGIPFPPVARRAESDNMKESQCDVFLGRALYGCVGFSAEERKNARSLLYDTTPSSYGGSSQTLLPSSPLPSSTPSPSPSPSPPSSPSRHNAGAARYVTKIPAGYVVNGRRYKDRAAAFRMANMLKNMSNIR